MLSAADMVSIPNVTLNTGLSMPMMSFGTWKYNDSVAEAAVKLALEQGFNHIDTAFDYFNQEGVGRALAQFDRSSYFITTKVMSAANLSVSDAEAYAETTRQLELDLKWLGLDSVDVMLLHAPAKNCVALQEEWRAVEEFYTAGKAQAIGVSNFCLSSFDCLLQTAKVMPAIHQIKMHVGMGVDPWNLVSYASSKDIVTQAYSPLNSDQGDAELIVGDLVTGIGRSHNVTGAQISLRWLVEHGIALTTKTTKATHMQEDLGVFGFELESSELQTLDDATKPASNPSWACKEWTSELVA